MRFTVLVKGHLAGFHFDKLPLINQLNTITLSFSTSQVSQQRLALLNALPYGSASLTFAIDELGEAEKKKSAICNVPRIDSMKKNLLFALSILFLNRTDGYADGNAAPDLIPCNPGGPLPAYRSTPAPLSTAVARENSANESFQYSDRMQNLAVSVVAGALLGAIIGGAIELDYASALTGAVLGGGIFPMLSDEIRCRTMHYPTPRDKFFLYAGANATTTNYPNTIIKTGYGIGFGKYFHVSRLYLLTSFSFNRHHFKLAERKMYHPYHTEYNMALCDVLFSAYSVDLSISPSLNWQVGRCTALFLSPGVTVSAPVYENSQYPVLVEWRARDNLEPYDFRQLPDGESSTSINPSLAFTAGLICKKVYFEVYFNRSLIHAQTMAYLNDHTQLCTWKFSLGWLL